jgi:hypothetical protein
LKGQELNYPFAVAEMAERYRLCGLEPTVEKTSYNRYMVSATGTRTHIFNEFVKSRLDNRWKWGKHGVSIDGELQVYPDDKSDAQIARDIRMAEGVADDVVFAPISNPVRKEDLPVAVQMLFTPFARQLPDMKIGRSEDGFGYTSGFDTGVSQFRVDFAKGRIWVSRIRLSLMGYDFTEDAQDNIGRAVALMANPPSAGIQNPGTVGVAAGAPGPDSAKQRKGTVMRN